MKTKRICAAIAIALGLGSPAFAVADDLQMKAVKLFQPLPAKAARIDQRPARVALGRTLFFDPRLSASGVISCNTCHGVNMGGVDGLETSVGHGWQKGPRNAPTVLNAVFNKAQFWDGRAEDLKAQAKGPIQASVEMNNSPELLVATLRSMPGYVEMFKKAFPGQGDPMTFDNVAGAIEAFEATLVTPDAPFDRYLRGSKTALDEQQQRGLATFMDKGCVSCHNGLNVGGQSYHPFGVKQAPDATVRPTEDKGRFAVTKSDDDAYVFRAPSLRNVALTGPYFHSGKVWALRDAVAAMSSAQLGSTLSPAEIDDVTAFLRSLTGRQPQVTLPVLPASTARTPRPAPMIEMPK